MDNFKLAIMSRREDFPEVFRLGSIYMKSQACYGNLDKATLYNIDTYDHLDGSDYWIQSYEEGTIGPIAISQNDFVFHPEKDTRKITCLFKIEDINSIDPRITSFGEWCTVITDLKQFEKRLSVSLKELFNNGVISHYRFDPVEYIPLSFSGYVGPFRKQDTIAWQNEYRIFLNLYESNKAEYFLTLPDLHDITIQGRTRELFNMKETIDGMVQFYPDGKKEPR